MTNPTTSDECLKAAFQALLRGDLAERDRMCDRGKRLIEAERKGGCYRKGHVH
jgi:hypothetical protein